MGLKRYTSDEFLNLLNNEVEQAGTATDLAANLNVTKNEISYARNSTRPPSKRLLKSLGLKAEYTVNYVSTTGDSDEK